MAFTPNYKVEMQMNKKVLVISDNSIDWNTEGYMLNTFYKGNPAGHRVTLEILIEVKGKTYSKSVILTNGLNDGGFPFFGTSIAPINTTESLRWSVVFLPTGDLKVVNNLNNLTEETIAFPDGIYTIKYTVDSASAVGDENQPAVESFVVTNGAEQIVIDKANKIADKIFVCPMINIDDIADDLIIEAMLFAVNKAAMISRKDRILNILHVINAQ